MKQFWFSKPACFKICLPQLCLWRGGIQVLTLWNFVTDYISFCFYFNLLKIKFLSFLHLRQHLQCPCLRKKQPHTPKHHPTTKNPTPPALSQVKMWKFPQWEKGGKKKILKIKSCPLIRNITGLWLSNLIEKSYFERFFQKLALINVYFSQHPYKYKQTHSYTAKLGFLYHACSFQLLTV